MRPEDERAAPGRPRDPAATDALLEVARKLVIRHGYGNVSIQMIAAAASVGRQTLYRRWPGKADLILEAFFASATAVDDPGDGPVAKVLTRFLSNLFNNLKRDGPAIRSLIASAQNDPHFLQSFKQKFVHPRAEVVADILRRAVEAGELKRSADIEIAVTALHGAFWYRLLLGEPLTPDFAGRLASSIIRGLR
jgi:AcrR family transcriptional regulator